MDAYDPNVPKLTFSTASAEIPEGEGNVTIEAQAKEGHNMSTSFVDARVDMPIRSGAMLTKDGVRSSLLRKVKRFCIKVGEGRCFSRNEEIAS